jgi:hypothetical protein
MDFGGWQTLFDDWSWVRGEGKFPIAAYSEFMPPPRIGQKPYGSWDIEKPFSSDDPFGWRVTAAEQQKELTPGFESIGRQLVDSVVALATGRSAHRIGARHLDGNPYWPSSLSRVSATLPHERYVHLAPVALSKTQDDKGRVRWSLFGGSHTGPAMGFWKSFRTAPSADRVEKDCVQAIRQLLRQVFNETATSFGDLLMAGFRILPTGALLECPDLVDGPLPGWTHPFVLGDGESIDGVRYLLTFRPFALLPRNVQVAYLSGGLHLLPCPGSLVFWGSPLYRRLQTELPFSRQILLLQAISRHDSPHGIRVPQSGWLHHPERGDHDEGLGEARSTFHRSHRWERIHREDEATALTREDHLHKVLFSAHPDDVGLYGKPMARNAQIWSSDFRAVLDGPNADGGAIARAIAAMENGASFGYRFYFPPMQAGRFAVFWHRPLLAFRDPDSAQVKTIDSDLTGYLTVTDEAGSSPPKMELWPRMSVPSESAKTRTVARPPSDVERSKRAAEAFIRQLGMPAEKSFDVRIALTYHRTAARSFEVRYWKTIAKLAEGKYLNKNSADCAQDAATQARIPYPERDLDQLGDHLLAHYRKLASDAGMTNRVVIGELPFRWQTDFEFPWMEGWLNSQTGKLHERNIVVVIPGRDRKQAVVMGDHYDTAYMEDTYGYRSGKNDGARLAASGADDNHSATAALMLAAEIFMELSREGKLERDIWLVHLTGEEFPSDCLGARYLAQKLVEGTCRLQACDGSSVDLSRAAIRGVFVLDMIAHNNEKRRDIFQVAPGADLQSLWLAYQAYAASRMWEAGAALWNGKGKRCRLGRGRRSPHGAAVPLMARHLAPLCEVRFHDDPRSTLFNTDGQIFADAGIPTALFMENYDINREGYHDTQDTMANIDLDYGASVAAIAIETVARAAVEPLV